MLWLRNEKNIFQICALIWSVCILVSLPLGDNGYSVTCDWLWNFLVIFTYQLNILLDFSLTVKAATLIFISGCGSAISSAKEGKSGFIFNLVKSK